MMTPLIKIMLVCGSLLWLACFGMATTETASQSVASVGCSENCDIPALKCCRGRSKCCCCAAVCGENECMIVNLTAPDPEAIFKFRGLEFDAPCCGPQCSMSQCLDLIRRELSFLQAPMEIQKDKGSDGIGGKEGDAEDPRNCCGIGCGSRGCFEHLLTNLLRLPAAIDVTLKHFNKSDIAFPGTLVEQGGAKTEL